MQKKQFLKLFALCNKNGSFEGVLMEK